MFSKSEIMDAARAASETGLSVKLCPTGEIVFMRNVEADMARPKSPEDVLANWLKDRR